MIPNNELFCDLWENAECEPKSYVWNYLDDQWQCSKCSCGLHRIYNDKNTLDGWIK